MHFPFVKQGFLENNISDTKASLKVLWEEEGNIWHFAFIGPFCPIWISKL